ncbi:g3587 [Coccomyxa elongata]
MHNTKQSLKKLPYDQRWQQHPRPGKGSKAVDAGAIEKNSKGIKAGIKMLQAVSENGRSAQKTPMGEAC